MKTVTRRLVFAAMAMALAFATSFIKLMHMPMGGDVTLCSLLFLALIGYWYGPKMGITAGVAFGLLQLVVDPYIFSVPQVFCDYFLAYGALGLSGFFHNSKHGLVKGYIIGIIGTFFFHFLSGVIFFGIYAPEGMNPVVYSFLYNSYVFAEAGITFVVLMIPAVSKALNSIKVLALQQEQTGKAA